ncbi:MAG: cache domain-containing protein, partial [Nitrospirota bacterium]|nr:cache domain-containing protein [Nitrospirota bacterium]
MPSSQGRALSRRYTLIASASVIPLIIMIVVLAVFQYTTQRAQLLDELRDEAIKHNVFLSNVMKTVRDHGSSLAAWAELYAAEGGATPAPIWEATDARLFLRGAVAGERLAMAQNLVQHMRLGHRTMPYLRWSYFLSGEQDFFSMFPLAELEDLGGSLRSASPADISDVAFGHELFQRGLPANNAARSNYWTEAYLDPAGAGWMVAHGTPVDAGGDFAGVIGSAVLLDFLTGFLRAFDYPCGQLWLVTEQGQLLAASDGRVIAGLDLLELDEVLPAP